MSYIADWEEKNILIIAKAYPEPSKKYVETVCIGGIVENGNFIRLYPIPYRLLEHQQKFNKWFWIRAKIKKSLNDPRKESYKIDADSIKIIRKKIDKIEIIKNFIPLVSEDCKELDEYYREEFGSLGAVEIEPQHFYYEESDKEWNYLQKMYLKQLSIFDRDRKILEKIKWKFKLKYYCKNSDSCNGHDKHFLCWEFYEAYRNFKKKYSSVEEALKNIEKAFWSRFSKEKNKYLILGTHFKYKNIWMIGDYFCADKKDVDNVKKKFNQTSLF